MEHEVPQPSQAVPSTGTRAAYAAAFSAPTPSSLAIELRDLRARLHRAREHAATALSVDLPCCRPGEALQKFLAADAEVAAIVRRIKEIQAFAERWKDRPRGNLRQV